MKQRIVFLFVWLTATSGFAETNVAPTRPTAPRANLYAPFYKALGVAEPQDIKETKVRPFITDDSRVVGHRLAQIESWARIDKESGQQWLLAAYGPTEWLEVTLGGVAGYFRPEGERSTFSYALPLVQAKFLLRPYRAGRGPGIGGVIGSFLPGGQGAFRAPGYGTFGYITVSQSFGEGDKFLFHGNVGANYLRIEGENQLIHTWGLGTQIKLYRGLHFAGEVFSGDPYIPGTGTSYQVGYRYFFSDLLQVDMTVGHGIGGANPLPTWFTVGVRAVTERFARRKL